MNLRWLVWCVLVLMVVSLGACATNSQALPVSTVIHPAENDAGDSVTSLTEHGENSEQHASASGDDDDHANEPQSVADANTVQNCSPTGEQAFGDLPTNLQIGDTVPDFSLPIIGGCSYRLSDRFGVSKQVLVFHRGLWCGVCIGQLNEIKAGQRQIEGAGGTIVAISPEDATNSSFNALLVNQAGAYDFPSLTTGQIENGARLFGTFTGYTDGNPRAVVILDTQGKLAARFVSVRYYADPNISVNQIVTALEVAD